MAGQTEKIKITKQICVGLLAHVDAGKTTLSEAMLYTAGSIRKMGRVDKGDAFLDTFGLEKARGITIFSKQANLIWKDTAITLLDTPGHVDFSAEMERTLQVLDYAVLVISGAQGIQGHTKTLWKLLEQYKIPVFLFVNKMDQGQRERGELMEEFSRYLDENCVDFSDENGEDLSETLALCHEQALEHFLENGSLESEEIQEMIANRRVFPCFFGSALKLEGISKLLDGMNEFCRFPHYGQVFAARVFKIMRDDQGNRLTFLKVTGGSLKVKGTVLASGGNWEEKADQIRIYSGLRYETVSDAKAGTICGVTGFDKTYPGQGLGAELSQLPPVLTPVLTYQIKLPEGCEAAQILPKLKLLEEEDPMLHLVWREISQEILVQVMGEVQLEVLKSLLEERFGLLVEFTSGSIVYKETIESKVEGVGHFEPLRHYAEVHLILEPNEAGGGLVFETDCSEDDLDRNWQRLVLTHLAEKEHVGILCGSPITDMRITLVAGRAHPKHTEGGDFRQATYRALRQGLMEAKSVLLEPYYECLLEVPEGMVGRAMTDLETMDGDVAPPEFKGGMAFLKATVPVASLGEYQREVAAYTKGYGRLFCTLKGYGPCHNQQEVIKRIAYDPLSDQDNPTGSVFCAHGAGFQVSWDQVKEHMHLECRLLQESGKPGKDTGREPYKTSEPGLGVEEIYEILNRASFANQGKEKKTWKKSAVQRSFAPTAPAPYREKETKIPYLLVDGYNIIFAWEELKVLAAVNIDGARGRLQDILCNYQAMKGMKLIVVYDAYRVQGHREEQMEDHNILVVFTKEAETADQYIEKFAHANKKECEITVATSDGLEQIIIMGQGCRLLSARDLWEEVRLVETQIREDYLEKQKKMGNSISHLLPGDWKP